MKKVLSVLLAALLLASPAHAAKLPTLRSLSTTWCPACKMMDEVLNEINSNYKGKLAVEKIDIEKQPDAAKQYNVRYIPTLIFIDANGKEVAQEVGYKSLDEVLAIFRKAGVNI